MKVVVTGASGKVGAACVRDLREHGHEVVAVDRVPFGRLEGERVLEVDLTGFGEAAEVIHGADAVVHMANHPAPNLRPPATTFNDNTVMNFNVFHAAVLAGVRRVVWASSETTLGLPFTVPPAYLPVDERHYPHPFSTYALSKVASETVAEHLSRWSEIGFVALRFSNVFLLEDYQRVPEFWADPALRRWNLWGYIDVRDAAQACRLGLEAEIDGAEPFIIAAADTIMNRPSAELVAAEFPPLSLPEGFPEYGTLLAIDGARERLGFNPRHSWREHVG